MTRNPVRAWLRRSIRRRLLVPVMAAGTALALLSVVAIQTNATRRLEEDLERRARHISNIVAYATESSAHPADVQRFVTQVGAEPDVLEILVAGGTPARILASTHGRYLGRLLSELPGKEYANDLSAAMQSQATDQHFSSTDSLYDYSMPIALARSAFTSGPASRGAVMVHLDTRTMETVAFTSTVELVAAVVASFGVMGWLSYRRLRSTVLERLTHIAEAAHAHRDADDAAWASTQGEDELAQLATSLREAMLQRTATEAALRQAERMASVGTLAGGIAHEVNTPLQFVSDGVHFLRDASEDVIVAISHVAEEVGSVDELSTADELRRLVQSVSTTLADVDVDYLAERVPQAAARAVGGVERVQGIVRSLKACADDTPRDMQAEDVNRAVQNALTVVGSECRRVGTLTSTLGALPPVVCHVGDIYRTVVQLLHNAVDAVGDHAAATGTPGVIDVVTRHDHGDVVISVRDNGVGIPDDIGRRVFEPFFTTKPVGRGTGQGLAEAWHVVTERHGGRIWFEGSPGGGTTFFVRLPVEGRPAVKHLEAAA